MGQMPVVNFLGGEGLEYENLSIKQSQEVNICPTCGTGIHTKPLVYQYGKTKTNIRFRGRPTLAERESDTLGIICVCPVCKELIYATYIDYGHNIIDDTYTFKWEKSMVYPYKRSMVKFKETIERLSPSFVRIYNQAKSAEDMGLHEICGIGYRKALEFLIKDYAKSKYPEKNEEREKIEKKPLKQCIDTYIEHQQIKSCATGAVYLANDETHYIRKWENKDITHLKQLIELTISWIDMVELTNEITRDMGL